MAPNSSIGHLKSSMQATQKLLDIYNKDLSKASDPSLSMIDAQILSINDTGSSYVALSESFRIENDELSTLLTEQISKTAYSKALDKCYSDIEIALGDICCDLNIGHTIQEFFNSVNILTNDVNQESFKVDGINKAVTLSKSISTFSQKLHDIGMNSDNAIKADIVKLNSLIKELYDMNQVMLDKGKKSIDDLDSRDKLINQIAEYLDIDVIHADNGTVNLVYSNGLDLVDNNQYAVLSYNDIISNDICQEGLKQYSITLHHQSQDDTFGPYVLIDYPQTAQMSQLASGKILAQTNLRNEVIPDIISAMDSLADKVIHEVNAIHNKGTKYTGQNELKSNIKSTLSDRLDLKGSIEIGCKNFSSPADNLSNVLLKLDFDKLQDNDGGELLSLDTIQKEINYFFDHRRQDNRVALGKIPGFTPPSQWDAQSQEAAKYLISDIKLVGSSNIDKSGIFKFDMEFENNTVMNSNVEILSCQIYNDNNLIEENNFSQPKYYQVEKSTRLRSFDQIAVDLSGGNSNNYEIKLQVRVSGENGCVASGAVNFILDSTEQNLINKRYNASITGNDDCVILGPLGSQQVQFTLDDNNGNEINYPNIPGFASLKTTDPNNSIFIKDNNSSEEISNKGFSHYFGMQNFFDEDTSKPNLSIDMKVRQDIQDQPLKLALGWPTKTTEIASTYNVIVNGESISSTALSRNQGYTIGSSSNEVMFALNNIRNQPMEFNANGFLPSTTNSFGSYFGNIIGLFAQKQNSARQVLDRENNIQLNIEDELYNITSIDQDDVMSRIMHLNQFYTLSLKALQKNFEMTDKVLEILR